MPNVLNLDRDELLTILGTSVVEIVFKKLDGSPRSMRCTRGIDDLPADYQPPVMPEATQARPVSMTSIPVFDIDLREWRSFRIDNLERLTVLNLNSDGHYTVPEEIADGCSR